MEQDRTDWVYWEKKEVEEEDAGEEGGRGCFSMDV